PSPEPSARPSLGPSFNLSSNPSPAPSLGSTILANGLLQSKTPANDPLSPIRRMSQAEKIALFS
ncbi:MAG: hypothetical protein WCB02_42270, partial [Bradyrhizobium sp.]